MADEADIANAFIDNEVSRALNRVRKNATPQTGAKHCKDCGEDIPKERRNLGFQLCIECAAESERRQSLFADF